MVEIEKHMETHINTAILYVHVICYTSPSLRYVIVYESFNLYIADVVLTKSLTACVSFSFYLRMHSQNYECQIMNVQV